MVSGRLINSYVIQFNDKLIKCELCEFFGGLKESYMVQFIHADGGIKMNEVIVMMVILVLVLLLMRVYKGIMMRRWKIKFGVIQILNDGTLAESKNSDIIASSELPFNGSMVASLFASYLIGRELRAKIDYDGALGQYLFNWEVNGLIKTEMITHLKARLIFNDPVMPMAEIELELYEILKSNDMINSEKITSQLHLLDGWGKKLLALGEKELLETGDVAFDEKNRIRFTSCGYDQSLGHARFTKYFMNHSLTTFCKMDQKRQQQELSMALRLNLRQEIEKLVDSNTEVPEILKIANRVWRVIST